MSIPLQRTFPTSSVSLWMRRILSIRSSPFHLRCGESRQTLQPDVKEHGKASDDGPVNSGELHSPTALHQQRLRNVKDFSYFLDFKTGKLPSQILCHFEGQRLQMLHDLLYHLKAIPLFINTVDLPFVSE